MAETSQLEKQEHGSSVAHPVPLRVSVAVFAGLLVLTAITVAAANFNLGAAGLWVALAIATLKANLVALYFMHLRWDRPFNGVLFLVALVFILLFTGIALMDTLSYHSTAIPGYAPGVSN